MNIELRASFSLCVYDMPFN